MWPKLLMELLPHFSRLMPVADKYLTNRDASDKAQQAALAALEAGVRGQVRHVVEEQAGIRSQLQEQSVQVAQIAVEVTRVRMGMESAEERLAKLEKSAALTQRLLWVAVGLLAMALTILIVRKH
jgi:chromosome segregation ATPase